MNALIMKGSPSPERTERVEDGITFPPQAELQTLPQTPADALLQMLPDLAKFYSKAELNEHARDFGERLLIAGRLMRQGD